VSWIDIYWTNEIDIRNQGIIVNKTTTVEENFMIAQKYVDSMLSNILKLVKFQLNLAALH